MRRALSLAAARVPLSLRMAPSLASPRAVGPNAPPRPAYASAAAARAVGAPPAPLPAPLAGRTLNPSCVSGRRRRPAAAAAAVEAAGTADLEVRHGDKREGSVPPPVRGGG